MVAVFFVFCFLFFFPFLSLWYCSRVRWALFPFFLSFLSAASSLDVSHFLPSVAQTTWPSQQHIYRAPWWWWWCLAPSASSSSSIPVNLPKTRASCQPAFGSLSSPLCRLSIDYSKLILICNCCFPSETLETVLFFLFQIVTNSRLNFLSSTESERGIRKSNSSVTFQCDVDN